MRKRNLSRRAFLASIGALGAAAPFIPVLDGYAEETGFPTRIVFFWTPNGLIRNAYTPSGTEQDFVLGSMMESLTPFHDELLIVDGVDLEVFFYEGVANDHFPPMYQVMTAAETQNGETAGGPSVDQFIAKELGAPTPFSSILLGVEANDEVFYKGPFGGVPPINDPAQALQILFGDGSLDSGEALQVAQQRKSALDRVAAELDALHARLGAADRAKMEAHLEAVYAIEKRLEATAMACDKPVLAGGDDFATTGKNQIDLLVAALACDRTRVGAIQWHVPGSGKVFSWLGIDAEHHKLAHYMADGLTEAEQTQNLGSIGRWYAEQLAYLLQRMKGIPEGDGTLLDHTVVVWCSEHNAPTNAGNHDRRNLPYVLAGSASGYFKTGRYVKLGGVPNNDLYLSLCHAMGLTQVQTFGVPALSSGPLSSLT